jgi:nitric oxide reductase subunit B
MTINAYYTAPTIPDKVVTKEGEVLFTGDDIRHWQEIPLKYGLSDNGTIWTHCAYLGPDFLRHFCII